MNATQRTIVLWFLIIAAVILHFAFISYEDPHAATWNPQTNVPVWKNSELFWCFYTTRPFWDQKILCVAIGLVAPVLLVGIALFIRAGAAPDRPKNPPPAAPRKRPVDEIPLAKPLEDEEPWLA
jgi:hypothetical protein